MITNEQVKTARALLGWSRLKLSLAADIGLTTVVKIETAKRRHFQRSLLKIQKAFEKAGVEFPEGEPVRLRNGK
jgi:transcriptional regulator with XRE-family HTH domain